MRSRPTRLLTARSATSPAASRTSPRSYLGAGDLRHFHSFRLILGEVGRGLAAYCGESVLPRRRPYMGRQPNATCPVAMREEARRPSGYSLRRLSSHFWRMVLTSGTRPLRLVALLRCVARSRCVRADRVGRVGESSPMSSGSRAGRRSWSSCSSRAAQPCSRWASSPSTSASRLSSAMGKPLYLVVSDPAERPLWRRVAPSRTGRSQRDPDSRVPWSLRHGLSVDDGSLLGRRARRPAGPPRRGVAGIGYATLGGLAARDYASAGTTRKEPPLLSDREAARVSSTGPLSRASRGAYCGAPEPGWSRRRPRRSRTETSVLPASSQEWPTGCRAIRSLAQAGTLFFASSAGGVYAASGASPPFDEGSPCEHSLPTGARNWPRRQLFSSSPPHAASTS